MQRNRPPWLPAALLILLQIFNGMRDMPQYAFFLIYLQEQLKLQPVIISGVVSGAQVTGMLMALLGGTVIARLSNKWALVLGLSVAALGSLTFLVHSLWLVILIWLIAGSGAAVVTVSGSSYLTRISARGSMGMLAALYALSVTIGGAVGNPLVGVLIERRGYPAFTSVALPLSVGLILTIALLMPADQDHVPEPVSLRSFWEGVRFTARQTNVRFLIGLRSLVTIFYGMLSVLIPLLLNQLTGSKVLVATYGTTNLIVASVAQLLVGRAADRWGARNPTLVSYSAIILSGLGLALTAGTVWGLFTFGVLGITAAWALATLLFVWIHDGVPKDEHPATFGLLHAVWNLSMITGSVLGGWFVTTLPGLPFLVAGLMNVGALFLIMAYYRRNESKSAAASKESRELVKM